VAARGAAVAARRSQGWCRTTYNYSAYPEEVREALDKWAKHVGDYCCCASTAASIALAPTA
jgi:hypothetical protein